jgi:hypothetical protein
MIVKFCFSNDAGGSSEPPNSSLTGFQLPFNLFDWAATFIVLLQTMQRIRNEGNIIDRIRVLLKLIKDYATLTCFGFDPGWISNLNIKLFP